MQSTVRRTYNVELVMQDIRLRLLGKNHVTTGKIEENTRGSFYDFVNEMKKIYLDRLSMCDAVPFTPSACI